MDPGDIALANQLAHEVLGRSLDELPPQTRRLLDLVDQMVRQGCRRQAVSRADFRFTRRDVREHTGWGHTQLKVHLSRLEDMEYLLVRQGGRGKRFVYELLYDGQGAGDRDGQRFLPQLIRLDDLDGYDANRSGSEAQRSGSSRPQVGARSGGGRVGQNDRQASNGQQEPPGGSNASQTAHLGAKSGANGAVCTSPPSAAKPLVASEGS